MKTLYRHDVRQRRDPVTGSISLQYVGRGLHWFDRIYGAHEGVFFVALPNEIPLPEDLEKLASACGIGLAAHPAVPALRLAVAEALVAEALVNAPSLLAQIAEPDVAWGRIDEREVERRHIVALTRVSALVRQIEGDLKIRRALLASPTVAPIVSVPAMAPPSTDCGAMPEAPPVDAVEEEPSVPTAAIRRAQEATQRARESELPQRLPEGARRALAKMEAGVYAIAAGAYERKADLCAAMAQAQEAARRRSHEVIIVDWDGEWPVVVRRYGEGGRIVYRVEDALRRAGIEEAAA